MAKLRDLITEREFGEPLPTFKDVMEKHQVNKLKEDWWDDMDSASQAQYIKDHPGSKQAQQADDGGGSEAKQEYEQAVSNYNAMKEEYEEMKSNYEQTLSTYNDAKRNNDKEEMENMKSYMEADKEEMEDTKHYMDMAREDMNHAKGEYEKETPSQSVNNIGVNDLASGDFYEYDNDNNYLGSEDYDPDDASEPPDMEGMERMTPTTLKQKYIDLDLHTKELEREIAWTQDEEDPEREKRAQERWMKAKRVQQKIINKLKPNSGIDITPRRGGMVGSIGHRTPGAGQDTYSKESAKPKYEFAEFYQRFKR